MQDSTKLDTKEEATLARPPTSRDDESKSSFESNALSFTPSLTDQMDRNITDTISGWDSDLSELTDSTQTESEVESDEAGSDKKDETTTTSGFKIRIPARPTGQAYSTGRRARAGANTGTPFPGGLLTDAQEISKDPVALVAGARLCSVRDCTYIIAPVSEYRWKMCTLCRLRRRERKRLEKVSKDVTGTEPEALDMNKLELDPARALRTLTTTVMSYSATSSYSFFPTAASSTPSFNLFIPSSAASSHETHEMYQEFGFILRPSSKQNQNRSVSASSTASSKASLSSSSSKSSRSSIRKWFGVN
ncbi:hypothetical protein NLJ89_g3208 [Agrocybe chaxingu]|uniref:Uncharacterized protein n=1 Tax=Agrocybe chaxingu TaxID=84603 RepID=A0A9W8MYK6_9AGAR|nr:hypothetical protein NLJ89_g3208 [Agrocybe chaxingu]